METEGIEVVFDESAIEALAEMSFKINEQTENIGARRLHTLMEKVLEDLSFNAPERKGQKVEIDSAYVLDAVKDIVEDQDLSRFIL
jgi:ATP-dependent HslUV protease ATP-binding subunit HslU